MKVKTVVLQEMMNKAVKGASNDKQLPITSLISIKLVSGNLTLTTTDYTNYLYIKQAGVEGDDISVVVAVEQLARLVSKMTSEYITMEDKQAYLEVGGNGIYKLELPADENGDAIEYPDPCADWSPDSADTEKEVSREDVQRVLNTVKPALAVTLESPHLTGYYVGDDVIGSNREAVAIYDVDLIGQERLISADMMNLLDVIAEPKFNVAITGNEIVFYSDTVTVYGHDMEGLVDWQASEAEGVPSVLEAIQAFNDMEFPSMCKVDRADLLQVLDRLSLFVNSIYDKDTIKVVFTADSMNIKSLKGTGYEQLQFSEVQNGQEFEIAINLIYFTEQVKAQEGDKVEIWYGLDNLIKMKDGKITQFVALSVVPE